VTVRQRLPVDPQRGRRPGPAGQEATDRDPKTGAAVELLDPFDGESPADRPAAGPGLAGIVGLGLPGGRLDSPLLADLPLGL